MPERGAAGPGADRFAAACVAFLKRVVASQAKVLAARRSRAGAPLDGSGAAAGAPGDPAGERAAAAEGQAQEVAAKEAVVRADVLVTIFKRLKGHAGGLSPPTVAAVQAVYEACCKVYSGLCRR